MENKKLTWAELVKTVMDELVNETGNTDDLEKLILRATGDKLEQHFNVISFARIATALYKIAGLEDELTEENVLGDLTK